MSQLPAAGGAAAGTPSAPKSTHAPASRNCLLLAGPLPAISTAVSAVLNRNRMAGAFYYACRP